MCRESIHPRGNYRSNSGDVDGQDIDNVTNMIAKVIFQDEMGLTDGVFYHYINTSPINLILKIMIRAFIFIMHM